MKRIIKFANLEDFENIRKFDPHSEYINPNRIKSKLNMNEIIIAEKSSEIVGLLKFSYIWATRPYIDLIWVSENNRGKSIGTSLLQFLENYLISKGYPILHSSYEEGSNKALVWHSKNNFVKCGYNSSLNLPHKKIKEIFMYKILINNPKIKLKTYSIL